MNIPFVNHDIRRSGEIWQAHPMQGVRMVVPRPATRARSETEVIYLVDGDSSTGTLVHRVATKSSETRKRKLVVEPMDDDSSVDTVHPPVMEFKDWSFGSINERSDDDFTGFNDWETLKDTFDSESSTVVVVQHDEDGLFNATTGESMIVWDGGSLSFLDGFKDNEMPKDFSDDDVSAIGDQTDIANAPEGLVRDGLEETEAPVDFSGHDDDDDSVVALQDSHTFTIAPSLEADLNWSTSCPFLDRPTRMVSSDDETPCIVFQSDKEAFAVPEEEFVLNISLLPLAFDKGLVVPWDNIGNSPSAIVQDASATPTHENVPSMTSSEW